MSKPITISINLSKLDKRYFHEGKNGKYLNLAMFQNRDGAGTYGDTHYLVQDIPKEARDRGERGAIVGNAKVPDDDSGSRGSADRGFSKPPARDYKIGQRQQTAADEEAFDF
jgi:hypothetical protein